MTFLQPEILWALPLIALPVIIHLLNRLRHRPRAWAAMQFLRAANRSSTNHAKLKQWLILLFRTLAVLALVLFIARPLAGGWIGWALSPAPDAIVILLDRSPSMEAKTGGGSSTKRELALKRLAEAAGQFGDSSHLILIENALREPQQIAGASALAGLSSTQPSDAAADLPAMLQTAFQWLVDNQAGASEIWLASDLQGSAWLPEDDRWKSLVTQFEALPQPVRFRLLAFNEAEESNTAISLNELARQSRGNRPELDLAFDIRRSDTDGEAVIPITVNVDGGGSQVEARLDGQSLRWRQRVGVAPDSKGGWGSATLPGDGNDNDNAVYFVYGSDSAFSAVVVSADDANARFFRHAAASREGASFKPARQVSPNEAATAEWDADTLIVWQAPLPKGETAARVRRFVEEGGSVFFFPTAGEDAVSFEGFNWGDAEAAAADEFFAIESWEEAEGPLAKTEEGLSIPLNEMEAIQRRAFHGGDAVLAAYKDGEPFLARKTIRRGQIYFCGVLPDPGWSTLGDGFALVPMLRRALREGGRRLNRETMLECGRLNAVDRAKTWTPVDTTEPKNILSQAGVYRNGNRLVAVNRPESEDDRTVMDAESATALFGDLSVKLWEETRSRDDRSQGEIWRLILGAMLAFLLIEAFLILPDGRPAQAVKEALKS